MHGAAKTPRLDFSEIEVALAAGSRRALVVTCAERIRVGRDRLQNLREGEGGSPVDDEIVRTLERWPHPVQAVLLRSWDGSEDRSWGFDPSLGDTELHELGYAMMRGQLALYRRLITHKIHALISTDLMVRDFDALRHAALRLSSELAGRVTADGRDSVDRIDLWILDHFSLWTTRPFDEFVDQGVPRLFALVERHAQELARLPERIRAVGSEI